MEGRAANPALPSFKNPMNALRHFLAHLRTHEGRQSLKIFRNFFIVLTAILAVHTLLFIFIMGREQIALPAGKNHDLDNNIFTAIYWVLITMSTVGYGDITFETHLGQFFSLGVMMSGVVYLFILLPFSFMEFFYKPLVKAQAESRVPRKAPVSLDNHVIITNYDSIARNLIIRLREFDFQFVFLLNDMDQAVQLVDLEIPVVYGLFDDKQSYQNAGIDEASLLVSTSNDVTNTNIAFTAKSVRGDLRIVSLSSHPSSDDVLELAGSSHVLKLPKVMAEFFVTRIAGGERNAHVIGQFQELQIAEARARRTSLVGKTIKETDLRKDYGVTFLGTLEHGHFSFADLETEIQDSTTLVLAGTRSQFAAYNQHFNPEGSASSKWEKVIVIGGGRVGRATAERLAQEKIPYTVIDNNEENVRVTPGAILGNAAEKEDLEKAGLDKATAIIITTHDDELNIFLTIYCRKLREDVEIFSRARLERNLDTLKNAGANFVISFDATGANSILNHLCPNNLITITEGLDLFRYPTPSSLWNKTVIESRIRPDMGCIIVAVIHNGAMKVNPGADDILVEGSELVLMGSTEAELKFITTYSQSKDD
jgi:voltage-gated potassium channel